MITECNSVYCLPSYINAEPLFKQMQEYAYNSKSPLLQANSGFLGGALAKPTPFVKPQAVKHAIELFDVTKHVQMEA